MELSHCASHCFERRGCPCSYRRQAAIPPYHRDRHMMCLVWDFVMKLAIGAENTRICFQWTVQSSKSYNEIGVKSSAAARHRNNRKQLTYLRQITCKARWQQYMHSGYASLPIATFAPSVLRYEYMYRYTQYLVLPVLVACHTAHNNALSQGEPQKQM